MKGKRLKKRHIIRLLVNQRRIMQTLRDEVRSPDGKVRLSYSPGVISCIDTDLKLTEDMICDLRKYLR